MEDFRRKIYGVIWRIKVIESAFNSLLEGENISEKFTEPFKEPIAYGQHIASLANMLAGGILVQRFGDLLEGKRSTPDRLKSSIIEPTLQCATPGDLSLVLPYRQLTSIIEMLFDINIK